MEGDGERILDHQDCPGSSRRRRHATKRPRALAPCLARGGRRPPRALPAAKVRPKPHIVKNDGGEAPKQTHLREETTPSSAPSTHPAATARSIPQTTRPSAKSDIGEAPPHPHAQPQRIVHPAPNYLTVARQRPPPPHPPPAATTARARQPHRREAARGESSRILPLLGDRHQPEPQPQSASQNYFIERPCTKRKGEERGNDKLTYPALPPPGARGGGWEQGGDGGNADFGSAAPSQAAR
mmetsp:Transcript_1264/g.3376  ORF Transcript_1264/g.3376 Transcript_1264/m.3376 type:complete len:240 (-) Transcript_1264:514-1233(-)